MNPQLEDKLLNIGQIQRAKPLFVQLKFICFMINSNLSKKSEDAKFTFAPSVQSDLFNYLKPAQRKAIRPFLQIIKRPYQEKLCTSLLDYLEGNGLNELQQPVLRFLQNHIIEVCNIHPLTSREPKSIGTIIKQLFAY